VEKMNRIFVTGDTHGGQVGDAKKLTTRNFPEGKNLDKGDFVIVVGDFGYVWALNEPSKEELHNYKWFNERPWTTLFVDGNHENFDRLDFLPEEEMFGGKVGKLSDTIYHLKRGEIYTIAGRKILTMGGGMSIDKIYRTENISWWKEEAPSEKDYVNCLDNLRDHDNKVDVILTHDCSKRIYDVFDIPKYPDRTQLQQFLEHLEKDVDFDEWYFGHYHQDHKFDDKHQVLYQKIKEITKS
jgi:hypothetical protein